MKNKSQAQLIKDKVPESVRMRIIRIPLPVSDRAAFIQKMKERNWSPHRMLLLEPIPLGIPVVLEYRRNADSGGIMDFYKAYWTLGNSDSIFESYVHLTAIGNFPATMPATYGAVLDELFPIDNERVFILGKVSVKKESIPQIRRWLPKAKTVADIIRVYAKGAAPNENLAAHLGFVALDVLGYRTKNRIEAVKRGMRKGALYQLGIPKVYMRDHLQSLGFPIFGTAYQNHVITTGAEILKGPPGKKMLEAQKWVDDNNPYTLCGWRLTPTLPEIEEVSSAVPIILLPI